MNMQERSNKRMKWKGKKLEDAIRSKIFKYDMIRELVRQEESSDIQQEWSQIKKRISETVRAVQGK